MDTTLNRSQARTRPLTSIGIVLLSCGLAPAALAGPFTLVTNGVPTVLDPPPLVEGGEVLLPAPVISHTLGIAVLPTRIAGMWVASAYGKRIYLRANTTRYLLEGAETQAAQPPRIQGAQMHVPVSTLAGNFDLTVNQPAGDRLEITGGGGKVLAIRQGSHPDWVRVVVDLDGPATFRWIQDQQMVNIVLPAADQETTPTYKKWAFREPLVPEVMQVPGVNGGTSVVIGHRSPANALVFTLTDPCRIVIDLPRRAPQTPGPPKAPEDLEYRRETPWVVHQLATSRGVAVAYTLTLPTGEGKVKLRPAMANNSVRGRATVGSIVSRFGAYAGLNGGYYASDGAPLGMLVIDGEWIKEPILGRTVLGIMQDGSFQMGNVKFRGRIALPGVGDMTIHGLNRGHEDSDDVVLFTSRWGKPTAEKEKATRVMLSAGGQVLLVNSEGRGMEIPDKGYVLSVVGSGAAQAAKAQVGGIATIQLLTDPAWPGLRHALGGGPRLVANGRPYITSGTERFRPDVASGAAPRSAIGILPNGDVVLVVVDGRQQEHSAGFTLGELAAFLVKLDVKDAMNLDGGGSATLVVGRTVVNRPSDGCSRPVANALLAFHVPQATASR
jgi:hypothetical protein